MTTATPAAPGGWAAADGVRATATPERAALDHPQIAADLTREATGGARETSLILEGVHCAGCLGRIERGLAAVPGVREAEVNYATRRATVRFDPERTSLGGIVDAVVRLGYGAQPYDPRRQEDALVREGRARVRRLGVAGVLGMQVMTLSWALYAGAFSGMGADFEQAFRWLALALTLPLLGYSGAPFLAGALGDLRRRRAGMDVPVTLGLLMALAGSVHATLTGRGDVYYDSIAMFVFLLLLARHLEFRARERSLRLAESLSRPAPALACRLRGSGEAATEERVPVGALGPGDRLRVRPGEVIPADGRVAAGRSEVAEAMLTGESAPIARGPGDRVLAGAVNHTGALEVVVERVGGDTVVAQIARLAERARAARAPLASLADRVAGRFVAAVLLLAAGVAGWWLAHDPSRWLPATVATLIVTCPCALSLATPSAFAAGAGALLRRGVLATRADAMERLAAIERVVLDKTGTLTAGEPRLRAVRPLGDTGARTCLRIAAALETQATHPLARALAAAAGARPGAAAVGVEQVPGAGVTGEVEGVRYWLGAPDYVARASGTAPPPPAPDDAPATVVTLARPGRVLARFELEDALRPDAAELVAALRAAGCRITLLSGDGVAPVEHVARRLGIDDARARLDPAQKLAAVQAMRAAGERVAMVGDGINDAPVLAAADASFALGQGAEVARASADLLLARGGLGEVAAALAIARRTLAVVRQNLAWAVVYNAVALPAAAAGLVPPWLAAIGMSASSLVVVGNSLRAGRTGVAPAR